MSGRRGQLLLIGGLGIAMTFVILAVVLNTVIFTQNLATREAIDTRSPIEFSNAARDGVAGAIAEANYHDAADYSALDAELQRAVSTWAGNATRFSASKGMVADVTLVSTTHGTRVLQSTERPWTDDDGNASWTMATSVGNLRRFHANVSTASLEPDDGTDLVNSSAVHLVVTGNSGNTWRLYLYENGGLATVTAVSPDGTETTCSVADAHADLDLTEGTIDHVDCGFAFAAGLDAPYTIDVANGENASARYTFVVDTNKSTFEGAVGEHYNASDPTGAPYTLPAIYAADVRVFTERADVYYERNITVTPERVPTGERYNVSAA